MATISQDLTRQPLPFTHPTPELTGTITTIDTESGRLLLKLSPSPELSAAPSILSNVSSTALGSRFT